MNRREWMSLTSLTACGGLGGCDSVFGRTNLQWVEEVRLQTGRMILVTVLRRYEHRGSIRPIYPSQTELEFESGWGIVRTNLKFFDEIHAIDQIEGNWHFNLGRQDLSGSFDIDPRRPRAILVKGGHSLEPARSSDIPRMVAVNLLCGPLSYDSYLKLHGRRIGWFEKWEWYVQNLNDKYYRLIADAALAHGLTK